MQLFPLPFGSKCDCILLSISSYRVGLLIMKYTEILSLLEYGISWIDIFAGTLSNVLCILVFLCKPER